VAEIGSDETRVEPGEVLVERKVVPAKRDGTEIYGWIILLAFIATCILVFFGDRLGITPTAPQSTAQNVVR
jgi:hypothetical protein